MAVHPVRTEAVCWISGRAENLMTFFALACLVVATRGPRSGASPVGVGAGRPSAWRIASAALLAVLAACSKEQGFVLALLVPCVAPPTTRPRAIQAAAVAAALGLTLVLRWIVLGGLALEPGLPVFEHFEPARRVAQGFALFFDYVRIAVWPSPLLIEYDPARIRVEGFLEFRVIAGVLLFVACLAGIARVRTQRIVAAGCAVFLLPLVPVLHFFVPIGEDFAERFLAFPVAGIALLVAAAVHRFPRMGGAIVLVLAVIAADRFAHHAADYKSARVLYEENLRASDSPAAKAVVAIGLMRPFGGRAAAERVGRRAGRGTAAGSPSTPSRIWRRRGCHSPGSKKAAARPRMRRPRSASSRFSPRRPGVSQGFQAPRRCSGPRCSRPGGATRHAKRSRPRSGTGPSTWRRRRGSLECTRSPAKRIRR